MLMSRTLLLALTLSFGLAACSDAAGPFRGSREAVFAVGGEGSSIFVIDPAAGRVLARPGPLPWFKESPVISPDSSGLYFLSFDQNGAAIYAMDANTFRLQRWLAIDSPAARHTLDGLWLHGTIMGVSPAGGLLYIHAYSIDPAKNPPLDDGRLALIDMTTRRVASTIGPFDELHGTDVLPPGPVAPKGAILVVGSRLREQVPSLSWLFVIDPESRSVIDSVAVTPPNPGRGGTLSGVLASPDGRRVYLRGSNGTLYGYDLVARQVIGTAKLWGGGSSLAISPDGEHLYSVDGGMPELFIPSSDSVQVFDAADLTALPSIFLGGQAALNDTIPLVHNVTVSGDGKWLYLAAGGSHITGIPLRLLVMDRETGVITRVIPMGETGRVGLVVVH